MASRKEIAPFLCFLPNNSVMVYECLAEDMLLKGIVRCLKGYIPIGGCIGNCVFPCNKSQQTWFSF